MTTAYSLCLFTLLVFLSTGSVEITLPVDKFTKKIMAFAIVTYTPPENAIKAYAELDGIVFQVNMNFLICQYLL